MDILIIKIMGMAFPQTFEEIIFTLQVCGNAPFIYY